MATYSNPVDEYLIKRATRRHRIVRLFMRDGELCPDERAWLEQEEEHTEYLKDFRHKERLLHFALLSPDPTKDTKQKAHLEKAARMQIVSLDDARESRDKVVAFPARDDDGIA